jgi:predicted dienelactone hydrolase
MRFFLPLLAVALVAAAPSLGAGRPVGVTTITFTKTSVSTGAPRVLETVVWYPAKPGSGTAEALGQRDAAIRPGKYPLVIFSHGNCGEPTEATYFTMALARLGFVVAAPPHVGNQASDGAACFTAFGDSFLNRVPDVRFVLDGMLAQGSDRSSRFYRRIRTDKVAMSGLSFGGFTTLLAVQREPRFIAAFSLVPGGVEALDKTVISIPTLVIGAERDTVVGFPESQAAYERLAGPRFLVEVLGANHLSSVDSCFSQQFGVSLCVPGDISQDDAHRLILHYALPFFRRYVRGQRAAGRVLARQIPGVVLTADPKHGSH